MYNQAFYESCDALLGISKQTVNINKLVLSDKAKNKVIEYVPHGLNSEMFYPIANKENDKEFQEFKKQLFKGKDYEFMVFFNSRNIRRKQIPDTILAYRLFVDGLTPEQREKVVLVLHTEQVNEHGTDLNAVIETLVPQDYNIIFTPGKLDVKALNYLYNAADVQILLTSNEGWGLSLTEALLTGTRIIANVTGGMQDQMRFVKDGVWMDFDAEFPSNHRGTIKEHGKWAFPVYPTSRSLVGSVPTPYIFDDRCEPEDAADRIEEIYNLGPEGRKEAGDAGREWALGDEAGFTSEKMGNRVIDALEELFETWEPREKYELIKAGEYKKKVLNHKLIY
jgi:hypothetical protein